MLKSEMQHQFWVTKKVVQRKLGKKEDECIVASDAELDAKIELFKSINESCGHLLRVIDVFQERVCTLAHEENSLGKFLREAGKSSQTSGKIMSGTGKAIAYCGQQRMTLRSPLLRLFHEVETFRGRAITDTKETIIAMERERTVYRAALSWMKSASAQLDPDSGKGLEKFRKAQTHVRLSKTKFDQFTLDCLQKIDLLAAARCNMFSHALVAYQLAFLQFATKTTEVFETAAKTLANEPHYSFTVLKELTQTPKADNTAELNSGNPSASALPSNSPDQLLFFTNELANEEHTLNKSSEQPSNDNNPELSESLIDLPSENPLEKQQLLETTDELMQLIVTENGDDLLGIGSCSNVGEDNSMGGTTKRLPPFMPSQLLLNDLMGLDFGNSLIASDSTELLAEPADTSDSGKSRHSLLDLFGRKTDKEVSAAKSPKNKEKIARKDMSAWFELFADLDPLANSDAMMTQMGKNSHAA